MSDKNIEKRHHSTFEQIKEQANDGRSLDSAKALKGFSYRNTDTFTRN